MLGIIRVLTTDNDDVLYEHAKMMHAYADVKSITQCILNQPNGIFDDESERIAIPKIVETAEQISKQHEVRAITISCAADPALEETRQAIDIPVISAGVCGVHAASMVGRKVGVIGITDVAPPNMVHELGEKFYSYSFSPNIRKTTDLFSKNAKEDLYHVIKDVVESGADVILFACTGFSTIHLKDYLKNRINIPIIDLVEAQAIGYQLIGIN